MVPIVLGVARAKLALFLLASLGFVAGGVLVLFFDSGRGHTVVGAMSILFFGGCSLVFARQLFDARPRVVIDDAGVFDRIMKVGVIAWDDILEAQVVSITGQAFVALHLRNGEKYAHKLSAVERRLAQLNRAAGVTTFHLNLTAIDQDPHVLAALIAREAEVRRTPPSDVYRGTEP
jgi:hypothetical protein